VSGHDPSRGRWQREAFDSGASDAKDGTFRLAAEDDEKTATAQPQPAPNVLQDIASALGGLDNLASWLYWERRGSASPSPLDGASNERRAVMLKALERVEKARRRTRPG